jgi:hypothetical protein
VPAPTPEQRAVNFQQLLAEAFAGELAGTELRDGVVQPAPTRTKVERAPDGTRWVTVSAEDLVCRWLDFPGETPGARPSLYRRLSQLKAKSLATGTRRGEWVISEAALEERAAFTDDEPEEDVDATLSDPELQDA